MINITRPRVVLERLNMELLIYSPRPKRSAGVHPLPALLFAFLYLRHLTNAVVAHIFPRVIPGQG